MSGCKCSLLTGRCPVHAAMMTDIFEAWTYGGEAKMLAIWALSDGYGEPGFIPSQGYDWSGIRDSSTDAVEAMWKVVSR